MRVKSVFTSGRSDEATMKPSVDRKPSSGAESWSAAVAALHDDDKRSDNGSDDGAAKSTPSHYVEHDVLPTDTLQGLSLKYKISATQLRMINKFSGNSLIMAPKTLKIPVDINPSTTNPDGSSGKKNMDSSAPLSATPRKGATVTSPSSDEVREVPPKSSAAELKPRECTPPSAEGSGAGSFESDSSSSSYIEHQVLPTDTLQGLCLTYKISAIRLRMVNKFSGNSLQLAPKILKIPTNPEKPKRPRELAAAEAREAVPDDDNKGALEEEEEPSLPSEEGEDDEEESSMNPPPDLETSKRHLQQLIESLSVQVDEHGHPMLTRPERTFLGLLLESNGPGVAEACVAARQRLMDGNLFGEGRLGVGGVGDEKKRTSAPPASAVKEAPATMIGGGGNGVPKSSTKKRLDRLEQRKRQSLVRFSDQEAVLMAASGGSPQRPPEGPRGDAQKSLSTIPDMSNGDSSDAAERQRVDTILRSFSDSSDECAVACAKQEEQPVAGASAGETSGVRSTSDAYDEESDCPICLLPLESYDYSHPLQCPSPHCQFNCCMDCLEHMIKSTKDESIEASDGNTFRMSIQCPNCRSSHLGLSIRDTLLLRKVDKCLHGADGMAVTDEKLSASELRFKEALEKDQDVASAIEGARQREDVFFGRDVTTDVKSFDNNDLDVSQRILGGSLSEPRSIWSFDEEEGFEADLNGAHKSFVCRRHNRKVADNSAAADEPVRLEDVRADSTLLGGLHAFMSDQEQQFVTAHLISGDTARLATATEMMHYVSVLSRQEVKKPNLARREVSMDKSVRTKVKEVIKEGNEARRLEEEKESRHAVGAMTSQLATVPSGCVAGGRRVLKRQVEREMRKQMQYMELHPLPLRMPKYAVVTANKQELAGLTFMDDMWDGTVLDAFSKITVTKSLLGGHVNITKQAAENGGVQCVIDAGSPKSKGKGYIDTYKPRVIVASINRDLGQQGIVKGDVVSHFNGEPFTGTASELVELVDSRFEGEVFTFVFNADNAVAEALKRRSMI